MQNRNRLQTQKSKLIVTKGKGVGGWITGVGNLGLTYVHDYI